MEGFARLRLNSCVDGGSSRDDHGNQAQHQGSNPSTSKTPVLRSHGINVAVPVHDENVLLLAIVTHDILQLHPGNLWVRDGCRELLSIPDRGGRGRVGSNPMLDPGNIAVQTDVTNLGFDLLVLPDRLHGLSLVYRWSSTDGSVVVRW